MTLSFQNKIVFPAPSSSYTSETAYGQVLYIPRDVLTWPRLKNNLGRKVRKHEKENDDQPSSEAPRMSVCEKDRNSLMKAQEPQFKVQSFTGNTITLNLALSHEVGLWHPLEDS